MTKKQQFYAMALAVEVQLTEGMSERFSRMDELRKYLRPKHDRRIRDAYKRGYFLPDEAWVEKFSQRMGDEFDFASCDHNFYQGRSKGQLVEGLRGYIPDDLIADATAYLDAFDG